MSELEWETACDVYGREEAIYYALLRYHAAGMLTAAGLARAESEFIVASDTHEKAWAAYSSNVLDEE